MCTARKVSIPGQLIAHQKSAASEKLCNFEPEDIGEVTHDDAIEESETVEKVDELVQSDRTASS